MRLPLAVTSALAYALGRPDPEAPPAPRRAPGAASEPSIVEPWRSPGIPDEPDPVAVFITTALRQRTGAATPASDVIQAYAAWAGWEGLHGLSEGRADAVYARLQAYTTVQDVPDRGMCLIGLELIGFGQAGPRPGQLAYVDAPPHLAASAIDTATAACRMLAERIAGIGAAAAAAQATVRGLAGRRAAPVPAAALSSGLTVRMFGEAAATPAPAPPPPNLRSIPGLRTRIIADSALLANEMATVLQSTRDVLEAATDAPGVTGDVVRLAAGMLDDALADFASGSVPHHPV